MCQVVVAAPDQKTALEILWRATSARFFQQQVHADLSPFNSASVDMEIGKHTLTEVKQRLLELYGREFMVSEFRADRSYPDPEQTRKRSLEGLKAYAA